jgi:predicted ATPase
MNMDNRSGMNRLTHIQLRGFKSIENLAGLDFRSLNVIIGANGAGKSNLVASFRMLSWMSASPGNLQLHLSRFGGPNSLLHDGAARTPQMEASLAIKTDAGRNEYSMRLFHTAPDTLIFADERYRFSRAIYNSRVDGSLTAWTESR